MKWEYKKHGWIVLSVVVVICLVSVFVGQRALTVATSPTQPSKMDVYLLHKDVLMRYPSETKAKKSGEKIEQIIHYLSQNVGSFSALLNEDTQLDEVVVKNGVATLHFETLTYEVQRERKVWESLVYSCTQFVDVKSVEITLAGQRLDYLPMRRTPLKKADRSIGINHVDTNQQYLHKGNEVLVYYQRDIEGVKYDVPRAVRMQQADDYNEILKTMMQAAPATAFLIQPLAEKGIVLTAPATFEDGVLHIYTNRNILATKKSVDKEVARALQKNFASFDALKSMRIHVGDKHFDIIVEK